MSEGESEVQRNGVAGRRIHLPGRALGGYDVVTLDGSPEESAG